MTTRRIAASKRPASRGSRRARPLGSAVAERRVALDALDRALLLRACARYRSTLPSYLASARSELRALARVQRKLAARQS